MPASPVPDILFLCRTRAGARGRSAARRDVFDYIEMFYNPQRKHARNGMLSPVEFERQQKLRQDGV